MVNLTPLASANRNQLKVHGVNAWDAIKAYIQYGIRPPISPITKSDPRCAGWKAAVPRGELPACHGGPQWTSSRLAFTPPPNASQIKTGQILDQLRLVGTFDGAALNEVTTNGVPSLVGVDGFVPDSLLSIFAFPQTFFHNGSAGSLDEVLQNATHRTAGTAGVDLLSHPADRANLVKFLLSIDYQTVPFAQTDLP